MKKLILVPMLFFLTLFCFAEKVADLPEVLKPGKIITDGENLFIAQEYSVYNYSLKNYQLTAKFVSKGQGPAEISEPNPYIGLFPDSILVYSNGKVLWYTKDGKLQKEKRIAIENVEILPVKNIYVTSRFFPNEKEKVINIKYFLLDDRFELKNQLYETPYDVNVSWGTRREAGFEDFKMLLNYVGVGYAKEKIFIADSSKGFFINVYDLNGKLLYTIQKDNEIQKIQVSDNDKKKILDEFKLSQKTIWENMNKGAISYYKYFPPIRNFFVTDDKIYILTYKRQDDKSEIIMLDLDGKILKRVMLPIKGLSYYVIPGLTDSFTIKNSKVYELVENPDEEIYELHIHDIK